MTIAKYEKVYDEYVKVINELENCRKCIQNVEGEFNTGDGGMGLQKMKNVLTQYNSSGFWQGTSAQAFADKLQELYNEFTGAKADIVEGLKAIEVSLEKKFDEKQAEVRKAYDELGDLQKNVKAFKDIF